MYNLLCKQRGTFIIDDITDEPAVFKSKDSIKEFLIDYHNDLDEPFDIDNTSVDEMCKSFDWEIVEA